MRTAWATGCLALVVSFSACGRAEQIGSGSASGSGGGGAQRGVTLGEDDTTNATSTSGGRERAASAKPIDPCSLITTFEVNEVTGRRMIDPVRGDPAQGELPILVGMAMCTFAAPQVQNDPSPLRVVIGMWPDAAAATVASPAPEAANAGSARQAFDTYEKFNRPFGLTGVKGVGQDALWDDKLGTLLVLLKAGRVLAITVFPSPPEAVDRRQVATKLFKVMLPRLPED